MTGPTCVIYNPAAGRGRAEQQLQQVARECGSEIELRPSHEPGEAVDLALRAAQNGYARIVAAGGDGTVHEVANGILQSGRREVIFAVWPLGSANDYAFALGLDDGWQQRAQGPPTQTLDVDVGLVQVPGRSVYMINCLGIGFNGMVTLESRQCRWLRGLPLYAWAFLKSIFKHFATPTMTVQFDNQTVTTPTLAISVLNGPREGNFPLRPAARLNDGLFDYMHATRLSRWHLIRYLPAMISGNLPENHKLLTLGRASHIAVRSEAALCVHADGEFVCRPEDQVREVQVEVLPMRLRVEVAQSCYAKSVPTTVARPEVEPGL
jgi:YegS/Rv2252/BmrU family lipid kinase